MGHVGFVFRNPANYSQTVVVGSLNDPAIPTGWVFCNSDGSIPREVQTYQPAASGGWPPYGPQSDYSSLPKIKVP